MPAVQRSVAPGASATFDMTLRLSAVVEEFDFNCILKLYDAELNQLDVKTFDLLTGKAQVGFVLPFFCTSRDGNRLCLTVLLEHL